MDVARPRLVEIGLFLVVVAVPVAVFPLAVQPFSDLKLPLLLLGIALLWGSGLPISRRLRWPVAAWIGFAVLATIFGTDPTGAILGTWENTGLLLLVASGAIALVAPSLRDADVERLQVLHLGVAAGVAVLPLLWGAARSAFEAARIEVTFNGSTIGNPVLLAIFLAAAIPAIVVARSTRVALAVAAVVGAALAVNGERSALLMPVVALLLCLWLLPSMRRRTLLVAVVVLAGGVLWTAVRPSASGIGATESQFTTVAGERQRVAAAAAHVRAFARRPILGWGPGLTWNGFVAAATAKEIAVATRGWNDAHDIVLQMFGSTGILGGGAFLWLGALLLVGLRRAPPSRRWVAIAALVLALGALYEPLTVSLTPLLFLFAAAAYPEPAGDVTPAVPRGLRGAAIAVLAAATVLGAVALTASALEQWGRTHFAEWSLRASLTLQPWRLSAQERLATELALDGRAGDEAAAAKARSTIAHAVDQHPWDPNVRLVASDVERLLKNPEASSAWLAEQHERFPNDDLSLRVETPVSRA
jgi:O-antigen ligase/polysaccharide polymerase Wzy-like membrane protein